MNPALSARIPDGLLAAMPQLREKPHQGLPSKNPALYLGFNVCNSTTVLGLRAAEHLDRVRSRYTGKERDAESGNDYFGARYYSSAMGRFLSPDPGPWQLDNPQYLNMYNYALNNPLRYTDAEGETPQDRVAKALALADAKIPYGRGNSESTSLDCSALVKDVWHSDPDSVLNLSTKGLGGGAANEASQFQNNGAGIWSSDINNAQPGDAIFFADKHGTIVHTGIVVDIRDGKVYFVHENKPGGHSQIYYVKITDGKLAGEKFAGVGRSIENGRQSSPANVPNMCKRLENWIQSFFSRFSTQ